MSPPCPSSGRREGFRDGPRRPLSSPAPPASNTQRGSLCGAVNLPHGRINERNLVAYPADRLFVVYCTGPHCNGADKAAVRLARLGRPVKKMLGGIWGWRDEGFTVSPD